MSDNLKPEDRRRTMQAVKDKNTKIEKSIFAMLAGMRLSGWKKNAKYIIGKPDIAFVRQRLAIFVDGCFWHGCPYCHKKLPGTNHDYWERKINHNVELAKFHNKQLRTEKWTVIRLWEHEITDKEKIKSKILKALQRKEIRND